jgi:nicotinate-nucleotide adenylyltransferase
LGGRLPPPGARIGLLGGSFNPAHVGHREISLTAIHRLGLDEVWWLVSPQNPLKSEAGMAPFESRLDAARAVARHPHIRVTGIEGLLASRYTAETLDALKLLLPRVRFAWLMGADNLVQLTLWKDWENIFNAVVIAVFDRPSYSLRACTAKAARRYARFRLGETGARRLMAQSPPAWVFVHSRLNTLSATQIRARGQKGT